MSTHNVEDVYGLSPLQFGMLYHSLEDTSDTRPYMVQMTEEVEGPFEDALFGQAWQQLVDRHSILRSAFVWEGVSEPVQVVQRKAPVPFAVRDLRGLPDQERRLEAFLAEDWERGFDLSRAPLVRVTVLRTAEARRYVVWSFHHILLDGWSVQILQKELFALYRGLLYGTPAALPPAAPYRRYIEWLNAQQGDGSADFWKKYLAGVTEPTDLHVDRETGDTGVGECEVVASSELFAQARDYARSQRITMNTLVQGLWSILLSRYSRRDEVLFGSTISGRSIALPGVDSMMGLFINTLPVRGRLTGDMGVAGWLRDLQDEQLEMRQWEYCHLVDVQKHSGIARGEPLFRSILVFENYPVVQKPSDFPEGLTRRLVNCVERTGYPLTLVASAGRALEFRFVYDRSRFDAATIERMAGHLRTLLESVVAAPAARIAELNMLTERERQEILVDWNGVTGPYPDTATIHSLIEDRVATDPDAIAITHGDAQWTFAQVNARANQLAHHLRETGITPDTLIAVCLDRSPELIATLLGIMKAGAAFVPLDPDYPTDRITYMVNDAQAPLIITSTQHTDRLPADTPRLLVDTEWPEGPTTNPAPLATPDDLAYIIYTSGSTGRPKGVALEHRGVVNYLHWCDQNYPVTEPGGIGTILYSSVTFDLTITALFLPLIQGTQLAIPQPQPGQSAFDAAIDLILTDIPISFLKATPSHLEILAAHLTTRQATHHITTIVAGGENLTPALVSQLLDTSTTHTTISNEYGATEGSVANVMSLTTTPDPNGNTTTLGQPITNTTTYVLDHHNQPAPIGIPGHALLGGICLARNYHNRPDLTEQRFTPNPLHTPNDPRTYHTGDLVTWRPDGTLEFIGRIDNQIKLRGYRIELGEIENALNTHPHIHTTTITLREDTPGNKQLTAYVVTNEPVDNDALRAHLRQQLPDYMVPATYVTLDQLPLTPNGKVDTKALPAPGSERPELGNAYTAPRTDTERILAAIWVDILGIETVGVHDNFFALGGQSISAVRMVSRIREAGLPIALQQIMRHPTVAGLAAVLDVPEVRAETEAGGLIVLLSSEDDPALPRLFCVHPGGGSTHPYRALAQRLAGAFTVYGVQAPGLNAGESPLVGFEDIADRYWREIRRVQPEGPCTLLGWSTGAVIAHAMGVRDPQAVAALLLLEPAVTGADQQNRFQRHAEVYRRVNDLWRLGQDQAGVQRAATEREMKRLAPEMNIEESAITLDEWLPYAVLEAEVRSLATYRPASSAVPATLFVSDTVRDGSGDEVPQARYVAHWSGLYPLGLDIRPMPGRHMEMVKGEEQLSVVAAAVRAAVTDGAGREAGVLLPA
ncbi:amino acid adenylation domain-containing protein [Streptomyces sp. NBC_00687]|uniref:amino acid adenylation domain-containing protein n=1 Tax=Streptomyces sp. NBC_00687 TaxID=2975807 RepID=UPI0022546986|nr:amino acid adenylation domain-containing protein [Streptomyces sp. NBC_00687]MCX4919808.1 amino acid adenylation domain-containing protein [Streptomyces sp. NBC_00687]